MRGEGESAGAGGCGGPSLARLRHPGSPACRPSDPCVVPDGAPPDVPVERSSCFPASTVPVEWRRRPWPACGCWAIPRATGVQHTVPGTGLNYGTAFRKSVLSGFESAPCVQSRSWPEVTRDPPFGRRRAACAGRRAGEGRAAGIDASDDCRGGLRPASAHGSGSPGRLPRIRRCPRPRGVRGRPPSPGRAARARAARGSRNGRSWRRGASRCAGVRRRPARTRRAGRARRRS